MSKKSKVEKLEEKFEAKLAKINDKEEEKFRDEGQEIVEPEEIEEEIEEVEEEIEEIIEE